MKKHLWLVVLISVLCVEVQSFAAENESPSAELDRLITAGQYAQALELGLADEIKTSDELLTELAVDRELYQLTYNIKQPLQKRLMATFDSMLEKVDAAGWRRRFESRLPR